MKRDSVNDILVITAIVILLLSAPSVLILAHSEASTTISEFNECFILNTVNVIYPSESSDKPLGRSPAWTTDWLASAYVSSKLSDYSEGLDIDPDFVNQTTGEPTRDQGTGIVSFGGPVVNVPVYYYELNKIAPVVWGGVPGAVGPGEPWSHWYLANGTSITETAVEISDVLDLFLIEVFEDSDGRYVFIAYGLGWKGTYAAGKYFEEIIYPNLDSFRTGWIIVQWEDANDNGYVDKPGGGDSYKRIASESLVVGKPPLFGETVKIGVISASTGGLDTLVPLYENIIEPDINEYCEKLGYNVYFEFLLQDAESQASVHLERLAYFHSLGVDLIIGGRWSSQAQTSLSFVNDNDMLLFSPSSTSPVLAIPDDNLFRLCPDDTKQAPAIAEMLWSWGIEAIIVIQRGDTWGDGLYDALESEFPGRGGVILERIRYPPEATDFSSNLTTAEAAAWDAVGTYGYEHVGVLIISWDEAVTMVAQAVDYPTIYGLYWFGTEGTACKQQYLDEVPEQADHLKIFSTLGAPEYSLKFDEMNERYQNLTSLPLGYYTACDIDIAWIIAQTVLETQSFEALDVINVIPDVSSRHFGYSGWCLLNETGDRYMSDSDIWGYGYVDDDPSTIKYGFYDATTGEVHWDKEALGFEPPGH